MFQSIRLARIGVHRSRFGVLLFITLLWAISCGTIAASWQAYNETHHASARTSDCIMVRAIVHGNIETPNNVYQTVCVKYVPRLPDYILANDLSPVCVFAVVDVAGTHIQIQCRYMLANSGAWYPTSHGHEWRYVTCAYYGDEYGTINACDS